MQIKDCICAELGILVKEFVVIACNLIVLYVFAINDLYLVE